MTDSEQRLAELEQQEMDAWSTYHSSCKVTERLKLEWVKVVKEISKAKLEQTKQAIEA